MQIVGGARRVDRTVRSTHAPRGRGDRRRRDHLHGRLRAFVRGRRARADQAAGRPDGLRGVQPRRDHHGLRLPEGGARGARRVRSRHVPDAAGVRPAGSTGSRPGSIGSIRRRCASSCWTPGAWSSRSSCSALASSGRDPRTGLPDAGPDPRPDTTVENRPNGSADGHARRYGDEHHMNFPGPSPGKGDNRDDRHDRPVRARRPTRGVGGARPTRGALRRRLRRRHAAHGRPLHVRQRLVRQRPLHAARLPRRDPRPSRHGERRVELPGPHLRPRHHHARRRAQRARGHEPGGAQGRPPPARGRRHADPQRGRVRRAQPREGGVHLQPAHRRHHQRLPRRSRCR